VNVIENLETLSKLQQKDIQDAARKAATPVHKTQSRKTIEAFNVTAIISAHNEGDVIYHVIGDLIHQGVSVYLLDHRSTDNTVSEASKWLGKGLIHIESYPDDAHYAEENKTRYIWRDILKRKTELAAQLDADWFIHADADEFRESPWPGLTLPEAFYIVDRLGYNAIDFELLNFRPVDNSFVAGKDVRQFLHYYEGSEDYNTRQVKAWKKLGVPIDLITSGGHDISFEGRKVFPIRFIHRHYPIRSQQHGLQKVFLQRKNRFCETERSMAWHIQYDHILDESHDFLYDPEQLTRYDGEQVRMRLLTGSSRQQKEEPRTLEKLAVSGYDTDKSPRYLGNYERYFRPLINDPVCILELGVFRGGSLYLWRDFFKRGSIVGLDANAVSIDDPTGRIRFYQGFQQDTALLDRIRLECAPDGFDVIIDDASHVGELTRISFWHLFENHLKPGGIYVIEDWGTGYWNSFPDGKHFTPGENHLAGMVGFVKELVDECGMRDITHPQLGRGPERDSRIERMEVCHGQIFLVKRVNRFEPSRAQRDAVQNPQGDVVDCPHPIHSERQEHAADALSHSNVAAFHYEKGDSAKAQSHFEKAVELDPANPILRKNLADFLYAAMKMPQMALPHYEKALSLNPRDTETLLILGNIRTESGDFPQAREYYLRVLELDPSNDLAG
ncbi:MAG: tetratricopeptide repeat protein, partial [Syntrophales bacterium]